MVKEELIKRISRFMREKSGDNFCYFLLGYDIRLKGEPHTWLVSEGGFCNINFPDKIGEPFVRLVENWGTHFDQREREVFLEDLTEEALQTIINDTSKHYTI